jgi:hypothetical protein
MKRPMDSIREWLNVNLEVSAARRRIAKGGPFADAAKISNSQ